MTTRIADDPGLPNHGEAIDFFNQLIMDLKKQILGYDHVPVTIERLDRGSTYVLDLLSCRRPMKKY